MSASSARAARSLPSSCRTRPATIKASPSAASLQQPGASATPSATCPSRTVATGASGPSPPCATSSVAWPLLEATAAFVSRKLRPTGTSTSRTQPGGMTAPKKDPAVSLVRGEVSTSILAWAVSVRRQHQECARLPSARVRGRSFSGRLPIETNTAPDGTGTHHIVAAK
eukprot:scaffold83753_cov72-Phaeocystis_antarctica.AAC.3